MEPKTMYETLMQIGQAADDKMHKVERNTTQHAYLLGMVTLAAAYHKAAIEAKHSEDPEDTTKLEICFDYKVSDKAYYDAEEQYELEQKGFKQITIDDLFNILKALANDKEDKKPAPKKKTKKE